MTTIETLTRIRDYIHSKCLPKAQGKQWHCANGHCCLVVKTPGGRWDGDNVIAVTTSEPVAAFIAATSDTAEPAWLCVVEEIDELLLVYESPTDYALSLSVFAHKRAASIINNWKDVSL